jgi:hypothetical protein
MNKALELWRIADLEARDAEMALRLAALSCDVNAVAVVPRKLIESASRLREVACGILKSLLLGPPAPAG